jgi:hypothetical protein
MRLLEREPNNRFQTAHEAHVALTACAAASRNAKLELQQLLRMRFPDIAAHSPPLPPGPSDREPTTPDSPRAFGLGAPAPPLWPVERTTHGDAAGQAAAEPSGHEPTRRILRITAAMLGLGAAVAVAFIVRRGDREATSADTTRTAAPALPGAPPTTPALSPPPQVAPTPHNGPVAPASPPPIAARPLTTMVIMTAPSDVMVRVEDTAALIAAGRSPLTVSVRPGAHVQIRADARGLEPTTKAVTVGDQDQQTIMLTLAPVTPAIPQPPVPIHRSSSDPVAKPAARATRSPTKPTDPDDDKIME